MSSWLSPADIQTTYRVKKTTSYKLLNEYIESGGLIIQIGRLKRVPEEQFTEFLLKRAK